MDAHARFKRAGDSEPITRVRGAAAPGGTAFERDAMLVEADARWAEATAAKKAQM